MKRRLHLIDHWEECPEETIEWTVQQLITRTDHFLSVSVRDRVNPEECLRLIISRIAKSSGTRFIIDSDANAVVAWYRLHKMESSPSGWDAIRRHYFLPDQRVVWDSERLELDKALVTGLVGNFEEEKNVIKSFKGHWFVLEFIFGKDQIELEIALACCMKDAKLSKRNLLYKSDRFDDVALLLEYGFVCVLLANDDGRLFVKKSPQVM